MATDATLSLPMLVRAMFDERSAMCGPAAAAGHSEVPASAARFHVRITMAATLTERVELARPSNGKVRDPFGPFG